MASSSFLSNRGIWPLRKRDDKIATKLAASLNSVFSEPLQPSSICYAKLSSSLQICHSSPARAVEPLPAFFNARHSSTKLPHGLEAHRLPRHVAIIMDGNSRWAERRGLCRSAGHEAGVKSLKRVAQLSSEWGLEALTVFAFSTKNWQREQQGTALMCSTRSNPSVNMDNIDDGDVDGNTVLGLSGSDKPWLVPWTLFTILQVMFLWFCTFWLVGSWIIPLAAHYAGCSKDTLTYRGQALYSLITDIVEGTVGLSILHRCLARFKPLPRNWFPLSWRGYWYVDVLLGCLTFPVVNRLSQLNLELLPFPAPYTSSYEQSIMARDPIASVLYAIVVSVCCPIWEEVIFRGFLLPSLTRYLPMWASIFVSAVVFGLAHFNVQRMLPLTFLGLVMGFMFVRSRNLLSSMLLHSLWNGFVFVGLLR